MRLLRRLWRTLAGKCVTCGTRLTPLEEQFGSYECLVCEATVS